MRKPFELFFFTSQDEQNDVNMFTSADVEKIKETEKEKQPLILRPEIPACQLSLQAVNITCFVVRFHLGL